MIGDDVDDLVGQGRQVAGSEVVPPAGGKRGVEHGLMGEERLRRAQVEERRPELLDRAHHLLPVLHRARVAAGDRHDRHAVQLRRDDRERRGHPVDDDRRELVRHVGDPIAIEAQDVRGLLHGPEDRPRHHHGPERVEAELEFGDDPEVAAAAPNTPEQLGVLLLAGLHELPAGGDHVHGHELIDGEPVLAHEPSDAAPEGEAGQPGVRDDPRGDGQSEGL